MMNSSAGDDGGFPPNPFRSQQQNSNNTNENFYSTSGPTPAFAQPPQEQFASMPAQGDSYLYTTTTPMPAPCDPYPYATGTPSLTSQSLPSGSMNTGATTLAAPQSRWEACVSCFRMSTYTSYFDVDTNDIGDRLVGAVRLFYLPDKFRSEIVGACRTETLKGPDLYGPLWITMTLVFFVALTSNLSAYLRADNMDEFEYDVGHLVRAMSVCFGFVFGAPTLWWLVTQCMGMQALMLVDWICLYGYSMVAFLPATFLCLVPWHPWMWFCLTVATVMSGLLVVRNVAAPLLAADSTANKAGPILLAAIASHLIFLLILKIVFYE